MTTVQKRQAQLQRRCRALGKAGSDIVGIVQIGSSLYAPDLAGDVDLLVTTRMKKDGDLYWEGVRRLGYWGRCRSADPRAVYGERYRGQHSLIRECVARKWPNIKRGTDSAYAWRAKVAQFIAELEQGE